MRGFGTTIFAEMSALAVRTGSVNLGQGFPDTDGPSELLEAAVDGDPHRPQPVPARPRHPRAARRRSRAHQQRYYGLDYDPDTEVLVTAGATEAIAASLLALAGPGDEVVVFEPYYDSYAACIALGGATRRPVTLRRDGDGWTLRPGRAASARSPRAPRLILLNTPHNPTGKVFTADELEIDRRRSRSEHDLVVISRRGLRAPDLRRTHARPDRDAARHARAHGDDLAAPARRSASPAGRSAGSAHRRSCSPPCARSSSSSPTSTARRSSPRSRRRSAPCRTSIADAPRTATRPALRRPRRTRLRRRSARRRPTSPPSTSAATRSSSAASCPTRAGVVAIPSSVFYDSDAGDHYVRFAFCKRPEVLHEALDPAEGAVMKVALVQHDIVWEDAAATREHVASDDRQGRRRRRAPDRAGRDVRDRLLDAARTHRRGRGRPERAVPRSTQARRARRLPDRLARAARRRRPLPQQRDRRGAGRHACSGTRRSTRSASPARTSTTPPAPTS